MKNANRLIDAVLSERIAGKGFAIALRDPIDDVPQWLIQLEDDSLLRQYRASIGRKFDDRYSYIYTPKRPLRVFVSTNAKYWIELIGRADDDMIQRARDYANKQTGSETDLAIEMARLFRSFLSDFYDVVKPGENPAFDKYWDCYEGKSDDGLNVVYIATKTAIKLFELTAGYKVDVQIDAPESPGQADSLGDEAEELWWLKKYVSGTGDNPLTNGIRNSIQNHFPRSSGSTIAYRGAHLAGIPAVSSPDHRVSLYQDVLDQILDGKTDLVWDAGGGQIAEAELSYGDIRLMVEALRLHIKMFEGQLDRRFGLDAKGLRRGGAALVAGPGSRGETNVSSWSSDPRVARTFMGKDGGSYAFGFVELMFRAAVPRKQVLVDFTLWPRGMKDRINARYMVENEIILLGDVEASISAIRIPPYTQMILDRYDRVMNWKPPASWSLDGSD